MARSKAESYRKSLSKVNNVLSLITSLCGSEQAAIAAVALSQGGMRLRNRGGEAAPGEAGTYLETILSNISGQITPEVASELAKWDAWKKRTIGALLATKRGSKTTIKPKEFNPIRLGTRIHLCGASVLVLKATQKPGCEPSSDTLAMAARCNNAACPHCARLISADRAEQVFQAMTSTGYGLRDYRMMTLTVRNCKRGDLKAAIGKLQTAFEYLRHKKQNPGWADKVRGYIWNLEVTFNHKESTWHPHIHILYDGDFYPIDNLTETWMRITKAVGLVASDRSVWIERLYYKGPDGQKRPVESESEYYMAAVEISKYNVKPLEAGEVRHEDTVELLEALFNRRRFGASGSLTLPKTKEERMTNARKAMGIHHPDWEMWGGLTTLERKHEVDDDPDFYARTLEQLSYDMPSLAAAVRRNTKLALVAQADAEGRNQNGK